MLWTYIKPHGKQMSWGIMVKTIGCIMELFIPYMLSVIVDDIIPTQSIRLILMAGIFMVGCSILAYVFNVVANRNASSVSRKITKSLRHDLFGQTIHLSCRQVDGFTIPSLESRLTNDTYNVHQMLTFMQRMGIKAPILLIGGIIMTFAMEPVLTMVLIMVLPLMILVVYFRATHGIPLFTTVQRAVDQLTRIVRENCNGIRVIKALSKEDDQIKRFDGINHHVKDMETKANATMATINPIMNLCVNISLAGVIMVGAYRVNQGDSEIGQIMAFLSYFTTISNALMSVSRMFVMGSKGLASAKRIEVILNESIGVDHSHPLVKPHDDHALCFDHVSFSYHGQLDDIQDVSFTLDHGQTMGIIGPIGSGKTTLIKLLLRFYDVSGGTIYIHGQPLNALDENQYRSTIGIVFQHGFLYASTIRSNITFGRTSDDTAIDSAITIAQAKPFINELKDGLNTTLSHGGTNVSGGQRQRILLSRALLNHPQLLILDDASSALDYATDAKLRHDLAIAFDGVTKIIVAQRISSIAHADLILVMDKGRVIAKGNHASLMESCNLYQQIYASQMGGALFE